MMLVTSFAVSQPVAAAQAPAKFTPRIPQDAEVVPGEVVVAFANSQDIESCREDRASGRYGERCRR
ncbi:MAG: hypothetical protein QM730_20020 [Anaerolineales bacterium]